MFVLVVLLLHCHVWGSIRVHHLWARTCFSMFEIELFICIKMDLALNNPRWLIYHKTKPNKTSICGAPPSDDLVSYPGPLTLKGFILLQWGRLRILHPQTVSFYQNSSVWLDTQDARSRDRNPSNYVRLSLRPHGQQADHVD